MRRGVLLVASLALASPLAAQRPADIAGCFRFDSAYFPVIGLQAVTNRVISMQADVLELLLEAPPPDIGNRRSSTPYAIRPAGFSTVDTMTYRRWMSSSGWEPLGTDSIEVRWYNGLFGPVMRLAVGRDTLRGTGRHLTDVRPSPESRFSVVAVRVPCAR